MKNFLITIIISITLFLPLSALAVNIGITDVMDTGKAGGFSGETDLNTFSETLGIVIKVLLSGVGIFFLGLTVYAGMLWITSQGEDEKVQKSQKIIKAAIIGMAIVVGSYAITNYIMYRV